ncbi:Rho guanine nucleotide exchange factor 3 [Sorochytrium milnesiophthora]
MLSTSSAASSLGAATGAGAVVNTTTPLRKSSVEVSTTAPSAVSRMSTSLADLFPTSSRSFRSMLSLKRHGSDVQLTATPSSISSSSSPKRRDVTVVARSSVPEVARNQPCMVAAQWYVLQEHELGVTSYVLPGLQLSSTAGGGKGEDSERFAGLAPRPPASNRRSLLVEHPVAGPQLDPATLPRDQIKRQEVIYELIVTERDYIRDLELICETFLEPIRSRALLTTKQTATLFSNIEQLIPINKELLRSLEQRRLEGRCVVNDIGDIFLQLAQYFKMYNVYCNNHPEAIDFLQTLMRAKKKKKNGKTSSSSPASMGGGTSSTVAANFVAFLHECKQNPHLRGLELASFLLLPVQRLCKYPLLLKEVLKCTPETHSDHQQLTKALDIVTKVVERVNEGRRFIEDQHKLLKVLSKLDFDREELPLNLRRRVIFEGRLNKLAHGTTANGAVEVRRQTRYQERYAVLLSDVVVIAKPMKLLSGSRGKLQVRQILPMVSLKPVDLPDTEDQVNAFEIIMAVERTEVVDPKRPRKRTDGSAEQEGTGAPEVVTVTEYEVYAFATDTPKLKSQWLALLNSTRNKAYQDYGTSRARERLAVAITGIGTEGRSRTGTDELMVPSRDTGGAGSTGSAGSTSPTSPTSRFIPLKNDEYDEPGQTTITQAQLVREYSQVDTVEKWRSKNVHKAERSAEEAVAVVRSQPTKVRSFGDLASLFRMGSEKDLGEIHKRISSSTVEEQPSLSQSSAAMRSSHSLDNLRRLADFSLRNKSASSMQLKKQSRQNVEVIGSFIPDQLDAGLIDIQGQSSSHQYSTATVSHMTADIAAMLATSPVETAPPPPPSPPPPPPPFANRRRSMSAPPLTKILPITLDATSDVVQGGQSPGTLSLLFDGSDPTMGAEDELDNDDDDDDDDFESEENDTFTARVLATLHRQGSQTAESSEDDDDLPTRRMSVLDTDDLKVRTLDVLRTAPSTTPSSPQDAQPQAAMVEHIDQPSMHTSPSMAAVEATSDGMAKPSEIRARFEQLARTKQVSPSPSLQRISTPTLVKDRSIPPDLAEAALPRTSPSPPPAVPAKASVDDPIPAAGRVLAISQKFNQLSRAGTVEHKPPPAKQPSRSVEPTPPPPAPPPPPRTPSPGDTPHPPSSDKQSAAHDSPNARRRKRQLKKSNSALALEYATPMHPGQTPP